MPKNLDVMTALSRRDGAAPITSGAGIRAGVVSNKYDGAVKALCAKHFGGLLGAAIGEQPGFGRKPAPDSALAALRALGAAPEKRALRGGFRRGRGDCPQRRLKCVGVSWGFRPRESLERAGADAVIDDISQLLAAAQRL
jgi:phosphoglycolate phosphatase